MVVKTTVLNRMVRFSAYDMLEGVLYVGVERTSIHFNVVIFQRKE